MRMSIRAMIQRGVARGLKIFARLENLRGVIT